ncbi:DeoR family transcriptional regulator, partial [Planococcus sp. SIMBA_160]
SEARPQSGQKNRSSGNFAIQTLPSGTYALRWSAPPGVFFNVMRDVSRGKEPVVFSTVSDGTTTRYPTSRAYYIANPSGA